MGIIERVRAIGLPEDDLVVIGSGLLDAWGLRPAGDIDLVVSQQLFDKLDQSGIYQKGSKYNETYLKNADRDIWLSWGEGNDFAFLKSQAIMIDGMMFVNPNFLIKHKRRRGTQKDLSDIQLLEQYLYEHN